MTMTTVLVNGAFGKMGRMAVQAILGDPVLDCVAQTGREDDLASAIAKHQPDVVLDLSVASVVLENIKTIIAAGVHPVIGTSGLTQADIAPLYSLCKRKELGALIVPNFSIGAVLMMRFAKQAAAYLSDVEIIEMHHPGKQDAPSGTAVTTAEWIAEARSVRPTDSTYHETVPHARGADYLNVPIHAVRLPGKLAHQQVIFGNTGETLTITHDSIDRACFMPGVLLACQKVTSLNELLVGLDAVLD